MSRRFEGLFVAVPLTRLDDPKEVLCLARDLKIATYAAVGLVTVWEAFVLAVGDAGRVKGYTADQLAAKVGWQGPPRQLIDGLKRAGVLKQERNRDFVHPYWKDSTTGIYAARREERREYQRDWQREHREGGMVDDVKGVDVDKMSHFVESSDRSIKGQDVDNPPDPPGKGGEGFARWGILKELRPLWCVDPSTCIRVLAEMTPEHWAMTEWFVRDAFKTRTGGGSLSSFKFSQFSQNSRIWCTRANYIKFLPIWEAELARRAEAQQPKQSEQEKDAEKDAQRRKLFRDCEACLADPHSTKEEKERARRMLETAASSPLTTQGVN